MTYPGVVREHLVSLGDRLLWGMQQYGVGSELFGATAYVGFNEALDPKDNYFYCDGTADDVQINLAEAYVTALGGGSVELERGTYDIVDPIIPTGDDIWYRGQGFDTFLDGDGLATGEHVFHLTGRDNIRISDMSMQTQNGGTKTCHCIFLENGSDDFHIHDVDFMDSDDNGIHIEGTTISRGYIHNNRFEGTDGHGIYVHMDDGENLYALHIADNYMAGIGNAGIFLEATTGGYAYFLIEGNTIFSPSGIGIMITDGNQGQIRGNQCLISANLSGIHVLNSSELIIANNMCIDSDRYGIYLSGVTLSQILGNTCNGSDASASGTYDGIHLDSGCTDNLVSNNQCEGGDRHGIYSDGARNELNGNSILNNGMSGIVIGDVDNKLIGNTLFDNGQKTPATHHEILIEAAAQRALIEGNHISSPGDSSEDCIHLESGADNAHIEGNFCYNGMGSGIALADDNDYTIIIGNQLLENDDYGVEITTVNALHTMVLSNHFEGNVTASVLNNGTNSVFHTKQYYVARDDEEIGVVPGKSITIGQSAYIAFHAPQGMHQLMGFKIYVIPNATQAAADWDLETDYGAVGEAYNTHEEAEAAATYNVTDNQWFHIDALAAGMLASLEEEDTGGISVTVGTAGHNVTVIMAELYFV